MYLFLAHCEQKLNWHVQRHTIYICQRANTKIIELPCANKSARSAFANVQRLNDLTHVTCQSSYTLDCNPPESKMHMTVRGRWGQNCNSQAHQEGRLDHTKVCNMLLRIHSRHSPWTWFSPCTPRLLGATLAVSGHWTPDLGTGERGPRSSITHQCYCRQIRSKYDI